MTPYVLQQVNAQVVRDYYLSVQSEALKFMRRLPDRLPMKDSTAAEQQWTCHGLCRAFHTLHGRDQEWMVQDGHFGRYGSAHSWIWFAEHLILDLYPIGGMGPFIVEAHHTPWSALYMQNDRVFTHGERTLWQEEAKEAVAAYLNA